LILKPFFNVFSVINCGKIIFRMKLEECKSSRTNA
jgi:hypothetical protein